MQQTTSIISVSSSLRVRLINAQPIGDYGLFIGVFYRICILKNQITLKKSFYVCSSND